VLCQLEVWEELNLCSGKLEGVQCISFSLSLSLFLFITHFESSATQMAYRRSRVNIRRAPRRRRAVRRAPARRRVVRRRTNNYRRRIAAPCKCPGELTPGDKFVMLQGDPFDTKYFGAKIPDSSTLPSIATPIQYNLTLTSASGTQPNWASAFAFYPAVRGVNWAATGTSPSAWTWVGASSSSAPQTTSFTTQFESFRPTAHSIRLSCPFAPSSTTGFVHIAIATETSFTSVGAGSSNVLQLASSLTEMSGYTFYKRVTLASLTQSPITLINKWTDETAFRYQNPYISEQTDATGAGLTFHIPYSWGTLLVAVEGASASTTPGSISPLTAEVILHSECIPDKSSTLIGSTAAAYNSGVLNAVSHAVAQTDFAHTEEQQEQTVRSYAEEVMNAVGATPENIGNLMGQIGRGAARAGLRYVAGRYMGDGYHPNVGDVANPNRLIQY